MATLRDTQLIYGQSSMFIDYQYEEPIDFVITFKHRITWYIAFSQYTFGAG